MVMFHGKMLVHQRVRVKKRGQFVTVRKTRSSLFRSQKQNFALNKSFAQQSQEIWRSLGVAQFIPYVKLVAETIGSRTSVKSLGRVLTAGACVPIWHLSAHHAGHRDWTMKTAKSHPFCWLSHPSENIWKLCSQLGIVIKNVRGWNGWLFETTNQQAMAGCWQETHFSWSLMNEPSAV